MKIQKTNNQTFGMKIPGFFQREILISAEKKGVRGLAEQKILDLSKNVSDEFTLIPNFSKDGAKPIKTSYVSLNINKGNELVEELVKIDVKPDIKMSQRKSKFYKMFMALTSKGIKEVTEKMNSADYLPL